MRIDHVIYAAPQLDGDAGGISWIEVSGDSARSRRPRGAPRRQAQLALEHL